MVKVGQTARDKITGFQGRVVGHADYITGCDQFLVQPALKTGGEFQEGRWFDEHRLEQVGEDELELVPSVEGRNGADAPAPVK